MKKHNFTVTLKNGVKFGADVVNMNDSCLTAAAYGEGYNKGTLYMIDHYQFGGDENGIYISNIKSVKCNL